MKNTKLYQSLESDVKVLETMLENKSLTEEEKIWANKKLILAKDRIKRINEVILLKKREEFYNGNNV